MNDPKTAYLTWFYESRIWKNMTWRGVRTLKFPTDMWNYQEIIHESSIEWIVETGTRHGGSALFFSDILSNSAGNGKTVTIDIDFNAVDPKAKNNSSILFINGDSKAVSTRQMLEKSIPKERGPLFMILDSDHEMEHVFLELENLTPILQTGDYLVVEDTIINGHPVRPDFGPGPLEAVAKFRETYPDKLIHDRSREEKFGCTASIGGYFKWK
jgi:cephalosporin hydroxylase